MVDQSYSFTQHNITASLQFIYNLYNQKNLKAYVGAGVADNFSSYNTSFYEQANGNVKTDASNIVKFKNNWFSGLLFKAGTLVSKKIDISVSYVMPSRTNDEAGKYITAQSLDLNVGFVF